jgi:hypothetical protein
MGALTLHLFIEENEEVRESQLVSGATVSVGKDTGSKMCGYAAVWLCTGVASRESIVRPNI